MALYAGFEYEDGRYFYKGADPNNYITFNDEPAGWRIMSLEPDGAIKIIRNSAFSYLCLGYGSRDFILNTFNVNWTEAPSSLNTSSK